MEVDKEEEGIIEDEGMCVANDDDDADEPFE
jgi:hypothetical protein